MRFCFAVGAGHAPPATVCYNEYYGYSVGRGLDPSLPFCGCRPFARRGEVTPPYGAIKKHRAVGAGHAPPATVWYNEYYGYSVGAAYMPPVAIIPVTQPNG